MSQTLRPDSNVTQTNVTGGYADIDETTANDADYVEATVNTIAALVVGVSNPSGTPGAGTTTFRYRIGKFGTGSVSVTPGLYEGSTLIELGSTQTAPGTPTTYSWNPDTSAVSNWNNLRLRFNFSRNATTSAVLYWAELEVPSASISLTANPGVFSAAGADVTFTLPKQLTASAGAFVLTGAAVTLAKAGRTIVADAAAFVLTAATVALLAKRRLDMAAGSFALSLSPATPAKGVGIEALAGTFVLAGADAGLTVAARAYYFEGHPKPIASHHRRTGTRSNKRWR